jgi:hypothetical protein
MILVNSMGSDFVIIILVSSARTTGIARITIVFGRSFMHNIKKQRTKDGALGNTVSNTLPFRIILSRFSSYNYSLISIFQIRLN